MVVPQRRGVLGPNSPAARAVLAAAERVLPELALPAAVVCALVLRAQQLTTPCIACHATRSACRSLSPARKTRRRRASGRTLR